MKKINTKTHRKLHGPPRILNRKTVVILLMLMQTFFWRTAAFAQNKTVRGKVTDEKGLGLPGASVTVRGTTTGVSTDAER